jgi:protein-L-isoaspartate(D-aspartate) O-methyltransferase
LWCRLKGAPLGVAGQAAYKLRAPQQRAQMMTRSVIDTADARSRMVDSQLRPNKVTDARVLGAMRTLPRERFLPPELGPLAYADEDVKLPGGRCLMEPMVFARLVQLADPAPGERVLVVGAGVGYGAAVIAACGAEVLALEQDKALLALARAVLPAFAPAVRIVAGALVAGWKAEAAYDLVFLEGAFDVLPVSLTEQVRQDGGRLVGVHAAPGAMGQAIRAERVGPGTALSLRPAFDCATPVLPGLNRVPGFVF